MASSNPATVVWYPGRDDQGGEASCSAATTLGALSAGGDVEQWSHINLGGARSAPAGMLLGDGHVFGHGGTPVASPGE